MIGLPASPRARRRLRWLSALGCVVLAGVVIAFAIPGHGPAPAEPVGNEGPAELASDNPQGRLTAADRRGINRTLDRFIPAGMARQDPAAAWALAGPELKSASTLADWRAGTSPVPYYVPRETTFHHWQTIDVGRRYAILNLLVHPKNPRLGTYVFSLQVVKRRAHWLVNRVYTIAVMNPPTNTTETTEIGPADFAAPRSASSTPNGKPLLGHLGILPAVGILALILLVPATFGVIALVRARRWRRRVRAGSTSQLPPLPSGYLNGSEERERARTSA